MIATPCRLGSIVIWREGSASHIIITCIAQIITVLYSLMHKNGEFLESPILTDSHYDTNIVPEIPPWFCSKGPS